MLLFQKKNDVDDADDVPIDDDAIEAKPRFVGSLSDPAVKNLPSHLGPKIRHKNPKISRKVLQKQENDRRNPKKNRKRMARESVDHVSEAPAPKKVRDSVPVQPKATKPKSEKKLRRLRKEAESEKKFNSLVQSYKSRLMSAENVQQKSKWFDS